MFPLVAAPPFYYVEKGANHSVHFCHCILTFAKQHTQAQVDALYILSILYDLYGAVCSLENVRGKRSAR
jgi:hypothetical protein